MKDYLQSVTRKDLREFLGSVGYYRRFIDGFAKLSSRLTPATSVRAPGRIQWTLDMLDAFHSECCPVTPSNVGSHLRIQRIPRHSWDDPKKGHPTW